MGVSNAARSGNRIRAAAGFTRRYIHPVDPAGSVDGLITGLHEPRSSHLALLLGVAKLEIVREGYGEAVRAGYRWHEFGDSHLLLSGSPPTPRSFGAPF